MPRGSEKLTAERKNEIIQACASLYETMGFKDITIRDIGEKTSFTRTSIYNYFQTKEEIFLALLQQEYEMWTEDLQALAAIETSLSVSAFASAMAATLEKRKCMLKLMSMNLYDMEGNSRMDNLVAFKKVYAKASPVPLSEKCCAHLSKAQDGIDGGGDKFCKMCKRVERRLSWIYQKTP